MAVIWWILKVYMLAIEENIGVYLSSSPTRPIVGRLMRTGILCYCQSATCQEYCRLQAYCIKTCISDNCMLLYFNLALSIVCFCLLIIVLICSFTLPLLTNDISFHLVNSCPIRMKLTDIFPETHSCRKKNKAWSWCNWGGCYSHMYIIVHQSIFRPYILYLLLIIK